MFVPRRESEEVRRRQLGRLEREITELAAHLHAATCRWLCLVAEFDRRDGWGHWGCRSCAEWLSWRCGLTPGAAREQLRVARHLAELPRVCEAFSRGELSYSQVRALSRVATAENEEHLLMLARNATAAQLEVIVRAYRGVLATELEDVRRSHDQRYVVCSHDEDGSLVLHARLPAEDGAVVIAALDAARDAAHASGVSVSAETSGARPDPQHPGPEERVSAETRSRTTAADALVSIAETALATRSVSSSGGDRHQVVVHVDAEVLTGSDGGTGRCGLERGPFLHPETARRLACDATLQRVVEQDGRPLSVGRRTRTIPPALRRALRTRDGGCRFPGCCRHRHVDAHHVRHWAHGGGTDLDNLVLLCRHHHRLLHEGGFSAERRSDGRVTFHRPDGRLIPAVPRHRGGSTRDLWRGNRPIDSEAAASRWNGDRLDLRSVVESILENDPRVRRRRAPPA